MGENEGIEGEFMIFGMDCIVREDGEVFFISTETQVLEVDIQDSNSLLGFLEDVAKVFRHLKNSCELSVLGTNFREV